MGDSSDEELISIQLGATVLELYPAAGLPTAPIRLDRATQRSTGVASHCPLRRHCLEPG